MSAAVRNNVTVGGPVAGRTMMTGVLRCSDDLIASEPVGRYVHRHVAGSTLPQARGPDLSAPAEIAAAMQVFLAEGAAPR